MARTHKKVHCIMERHQIPIILGFRFLYGLRTVTPFVIGMSQVSMTEFVVLNVIGAALWAIVIGALGNAFGHALELILGDIQHYEMEILPVILIAGILLWMSHIART